MQNKSLKYIIKGTYRTARITCAKSYSILNTVTRNESTSLMQMTNGCKDNHLTARKYTK